MRKTAAAPNAEKLCQLLEAFLAGRNERTIVAYRADLEDFRSFVGEKTVEDVARRLLEAHLGDANALALAYKAHLLERKLSPNTTNRRLAALRSLVELGRTLGIISWSLAIRNVKTQPYRDTRGPGITAFKKVMAIAAGQVDVKAKRDVAILRLLFDLGLRRSEVVGLDVEDLDLDAGFIAVLGKGQMQKQRLKLPDLTKSVLKAWLNISGATSGPVFLNCDRSTKAHKRLTPSGLYFIVRRLGQKAGIKLRPHGLRHLSITQAVKMAQEHGLGLEEVCDFSRHHAVTTLMVYRDKDQDLQGQIANLVAGAVE